MSLPLVTVVCLCYNHERFVTEAIQSVLLQTHPNIQLIVVDDHSADASVDAIKKAIHGHPGILFIPLPSNVGNCKAFNEGLKRAEGRFVIDLAADDALMPERVERGLRLLEEHGPRAGVAFSDAVLMDESGNPKGLHSDRFPHATIPQGEIYADLLGRYFVNSPTMMMRREVLDALGGYDEQLAYEDFDFWIRSSRNYTYHYSPLPLVRRRMLPDSMGQSQYKKSSRLMWSTLEVCKKALALNRNAREHDALKKRIRYEAKQAILAGDLGLGWGLLQTLEESAIKSPAELADFRRRWHKQRASAFQSILRGSITKTLEDSALRSPAELADLRRRLLRFAFMLILRFLRILREKNLCNQMKFTSGCPSPSPY